jgi:hypothetical protein
MINAGDMRAVQMLIGRLGSEIKGLIKSALEISYFSRGAWQYDQVLAMSAGERELAVEFINERLKAAGKMTFPVF